MARAGNVARWRIILAFLLDLVSSFVVLGFLIAFVTGEITATGFSLKGWAAVSLVAAIAAYFVVFDKFLGGTVWKRILRATG